MRVLPALLALSLVACATTPMPPSSVGSIGPTPAAVASFSVEPRDPVDPARAQEIYDANRDLFAYDASLPLDVRQPAEPIRETDFAVTYDLTYASPMGGRVPAVLILPKVEGPVPAVIIQHGMPGSRFDLQWRGVELAQLGVASILIDAPHARMPAQRPGPGTQPTNFTEQDRAEQLQVIVDLRRAVDVLQSRPEVDAERIGYLGVSYGGAMGGLLAGLEDRIKAYVLAVGDGGLVTNQTGSEDDAGAFAGLTLEEQQRWLALLEPIEPINYVGQARSPVLFQSGMLDEIVPPHDAAAYHAAGNDLSEVRWYEANHGLNDAARCDAAAWLGEHLGFDGSALVGC